MLFLKQSTASQSVLIGPFIDDDDGFSPLTSLTIANTDIRLSKNGGNLASKNSGGGTHDELGYYTITLDATDTNTVGRLQLLAQPTDSLPVYHEFWVLEEAIYDALFAASAAGFDANQRTNVGRWLDQAVTLSGNNRPDVNIDEISDDTGAPANLEAMFDGTGYAGGTTKLDVNLVTWRGSQPNTLSSGRVEVLVGAMATGVIAAATFAAGALDAVWSTTTRLLTAGTNIVLAKGTGVTGFNDLSAAQVNAEVDTAIADASLATATELSTVEGKVDTVDGLVDTIKATTDKLDDTLEDDGGTHRFTEAALAEAPTGSGGGGGGASASEVAAAVWDEALASHSTSGSAGRILNDVPTAVVIAAAVWSYAVKTGWSAGRFLKIIGASAMAKVSGMDTNTPLFRNVTDDGDAISAVVDANGNRTAVTAYEED